MNEETIEKFSQYLSKTKAKFEYCGRMYSPVEIERYFDGSCRVIQAYSLLLLPITSPGPEIQEELFPEIVAEMEQYMPEKKIKLYQIDTKLRAICSQAIGRGDDEQQDTCYLVTVRVGIKEIK